MITMRPGCIATGGRATWRAGTLPAAGSALSALLGTQLSRDRPSQSSSTDLGRGSKRNKSQKQNYVRRVPPHRGTQ